MTSTVITASPDTPLSELVDSLLHHGISGLPIVDDDAHLVGTVTEAGLVSNGGLRAGDPALEAQHGRRSLAVRS